MVQLLDKLVKQIAPTVDTTKLRIVRDSPMWHKVIDGQLFVPPTSVLHKNIVELDKFVEALKAFSWYEPTNSMYNWTDLQCTTISETPAIKELHDSLRHYKYTATDIETKRIEWEDNHMLSIGFAYNDNCAVAIEWSKLSDSGYDALQQILRDPTITFIWHNGKFDCTRLKYLANIEARVDEDTQLMHYACINERQGTHKLKDLGPLYLQAPQWDDELEELKARYCRQHKILLKQFTYDQIPMNVLIPYMQRDCIATLRLWYLFQQLQIPGTQWIYKKLCEASNTYKDVELAGFPINMEYMEDLEFTLETQLAKATKVFQTAVDKEWNPVVYVQESGAKSFPKSFNLKSPKQLKWLLEKMVGHTLESTDSATIDSLKGDNPQHDEFLTALKTVRKLNKQIDTYICGYRERVCRDHRLRGQFNLHGTETGRLSSNDPNMQNIPREGPIKKLFIASPGKVLLQMDYSQAELRVLAHLSQDTYMTQLYVEGKDIHSEMARQVYGENWTKENRSACKSIVFGSIYGRGPSSVAEQTGVSMTEARRLIEKVFSYMPQARDWIAQRRQMASKGEDCISIFGRHRHFVMLSHDALNHIQNEYINTPVQSAASDLTMFALMAIHDWLLQSDLSEKAQIISTVHDSIILEVAPELLDTVAQQCSHIMATVPKQMLPDLKVPFKADAEHGTVWGELKSWIKS